MQTYNTFAYNRIADRLEKITRPQALSDQRLRAQDAFISAEVRVGMGQGSNALRLLTKALADVHTAVAPWYIQEAEVLLEQLNHLSFAYGACRKADEVLIRAREVLRRGDAGQAIEMAQSAYWCLRAAQNSPEAREYFGARSGRTQTPKSEEAKRRQADNRAKHAQQQRDTKVGKKGK